MNLQDALVYRQKCLIHQQDLQPVCIAPKACKVENQVNGIQIAIEEKMKKRDSIHHFLRLNYDGNWDTKVDQSGSWLLPPEFKDRIMDLKNTSIGAGEGPNLRLLMICPDCYDCNASIGSYTGRMLAPVLPMLKTIHKLTHNYCILVKGLDNNKFECEIDSESLHYAKDGRFYQVIAHPQSGKAKFIMGALTGITLAKLEDASLYLEVPRFDFTKVTTLDRLIEKIKIYSLFS